MGISMNLVTYLLWDLHLSSAKSATIVTNFLGALNLLGLLGGFLADAKLGRFLTVATFASITAVVSSEPLRMASREKYLLYPPAFLVFAGCDFVNIGHNHPWHETSSL